MVPNDDVVWEKLYLNVEGEQSCQFEGPFMEAGAYCHHCGVLGSLLYMCIHRQVYKWECQNLYWGLSSDGSTQSYVFPVSESVACFYYAINNSYMICQCMYLSLCTPVSRRVEARKSQIIH